MRYPKTVDDLLALKDDDPEEALWYAACQEMAYGAGSHLAVIAVLKPAVASFCLTWDLDAEVHNGGFQQFFWNSGYETCDAAMEALRRFALAEHEAMYAEALRRWKASGWSEAVPRQHEMPRRAWLALDYPDVDFDDLDPRWYALTPMTGARVARIRREPERYWPVR